MSVTKPIICKRRSRDWGTRWLQPLMAPSTARLEKPILLGSECPIRVPGNDSGHEQQDSQHVSTFGVLFPLVSALIRFPGMLCS